jgi:ADP-heptose:LPS heptosyltransferase
MHLAAAVGTRCVTIYSAQAPPGQWFPVGPGHLNLYPYEFFDPARARDPAYQRKAISSIRVADVLEAARSCLS